MMPLAVILWGGAAALGLALLSTFFAKSNDTGVP
jgi:hypothetical protein